MLEKIISGGQTGADRAALDAAIASGLAHGGWVPKGRRTEDGPLPAAYHLKEMPTTAYPARTARNVSDADATAIFSHGRLKGGSRLTLALARQHGKPVVHLDLSRTAAFAAARQLADWIGQNHVRVLNVAGPRASEDPAIYQKTRDILETAILLGLVSDGPAGDARRPSVSQAARSQTDPATSVEEAVEQLIGQMALKDKATIANLTFEELAFLKPTLGRHIAERFGLENGNQALLDACRFSAGKARITPTQAVEVILAALWERLRHSYRLRRVK